MIPETSHDPETPGRNPVTAYISIGSNIGDRLININRAIEFLRAGDLQVRELSSVYETEPWGMSDQHPFYNQVIKIKTSLPARDLINFLLETEEFMGRIRDLKYGPRKIDLDILFYGEDIVDETNLKIPHPYLQNRRFILIPLMEIAPNLNHPVFDKTIETLLQECDDPLTVQKI